MNEEITNLDMAVSLFSKAGSIEEVGLSVSTSMRLPIGMHSVCKAIAQHSGHSLNRVLIQLVTVGLDAVMANLPESDVNAINRHCNEIITAAVEDDFKGAESGEIK
jgi:hypothetical protein